MASLFTQGRQKLARFNAHEFATLVIDILSDAKRRQQGGSVTSPKGEVGERDMGRASRSSGALGDGPLTLVENVELILKNVSSRHGSEGQDSEQPDYDSVASDEDTDPDAPTGKGNRTKVPTTTGVNV